MTGFVFCGLTILLANVVLVHSAPKAQTAEYQKNLFETFFISKSKCNLANNTWSGRNLTYLIYDNIKRGEDFIMPSINKAVAKWSDYANVNLTRKMTAPADITILFYQFDYYNWCINASKMVSKETISEEIYTVAFGQIGTQLGLLHPKWEMRENKKQIKDCESEIRKDWCRNLKIDTIFTDYRGDLYAFKGYRYLGFNLADLYNGRSKPITERWRGLPGNIDAAFTHKRTNQTFFFKNTTVWSYTMDILDPDFPQDIRELFPDKFTPFDDVLYHNDELVIFHGDSYYVYSYRDNAMSEAKPISQLGLPNNIDAAFEYSNGYTYFFKDDKFYSLNFDERNRNKTELGTPLIPESTRQFFLSCNSNRDKVK